MIVSPTAVLFRDIGGLVGPVVEGVSLVKTVADFVVDFVVTDCVDGVLRSNEKKRRKSSLLRTVVLSICSFM